MGRQALIMGLCCLMIGGTWAVNSYIWKDPHGADSASRLYRQATGLVYASAAPYGAYSFQIPAISTQGAASRIIPVKESLTLQHANGNGYLKDSYGNRFVEALQSMKALPLKPFPQKYLQLQELPAHFAQPLSAAAPTAYQQYKQAPQMFVGSHYRLPLQASAPMQFNQHASFVHPGVYPDTIKNLSPAPGTYSQHFGSVIHAPVQTKSVAPTRESLRSSPSPPDSTHSLSEHQEHRSTPQHSSGHKTVHVEVQSHERYHDLPGEHKFQRLQEAPQHTSGHKPGHVETQSHGHYHHLPGEHKFQRLQKASHESHSEEETPAPARQVKHKVTTQQLVSAIKETPIPTEVNGKKTIVNVKTKPPLPLLDINLLEPLTFANPLVPQVQHFLPRIHDATYHKLPELDTHEDKKYQKEFVIQKTKSYDSGVTKGKSKNTKNKHKTPRIEHTYHDDYIPAATARPQVTVTKALDDAPEIIYEINSPNYKETIKEKAVSYNKATNSEPVHYTYGTKTHKEPVQYSFSHTSKEPVHIQEVRYEGKGEGPKHLIYNVKPEEHANESEKSKTESEDSGDSSEHSEESPHRAQHGEHHAARQEAPKETQHYRPDQRDREHHHKPSSDSHHNVHHSHHHRPSSDSHHNVHNSDHEHLNKPSSNGHHEHHEYPKQSSGAHLNVQHREQDYHYKPHADTHHKVQHSNKPVQYESIDVIPFQYEEDISLTAPIKVDPNQHVQHGYSEPRSSPSPQHHTRPSDPPQQQPQTDSKSHHEQDAPSTYVHEKNKQVYIKEETPEEDDNSGEHFMKAIFGKEEDKEKDFENAYKNAAFGFPAYDKTGADVEKDIYSPESYGVPPEHSAYDIDHTPFQQYQEEGDDFPKEKRLNYKDGRDKMKEDYFLDYSISKPESLADRYQNKANYYKLYKDQRPEKYVAFEENQNKQKSAKLTAIPYSFYPVHGDNMKLFSSQYKSVPYVLEYDYSKGAPAKPKDNSAHASRPFQRYKITTHFVEPQFQYGFEPIAIPQLLDSELAAMASNDSLDRDKPGTRKKIYKENFYINKTSLSDAVPNS